MDVNVLVAGRAVVDAYGDKLGFASQTQLLALNDAAALCAVLVELDAFVL